MRNQLTDRSSGSNRMPGEVPGRTFRRPCLALVWLLLAGVCIAPAAFAQQGAGPGQAVGRGGRYATPQDEILKKVRLDQKLNAQIPLDVGFRDENGREVRLHEYFRGKPVMLILIQYRCAMLCNEQMNILVDSLKKMEFTPGKEFTLLTVSIDPREGPDFALEKKKAYLEEYGRPAAGEGWHYLTGDERSIRRLADSVGFYYHYDAATDQYAHPDGVILVTPNGKVARYFFRLSYPARDLRLGLVEASENRIGTPLDAIALLCFHYNPVTGKYSLTYMGILRLAGILTVVGILLWIIVMRWREWRGARGVRVAAPVGGEG